MKPRARWLAAIALGLCAALLRWWIAPAFERLPDDYLAETRYEATMSTRQSPSSTAEEISIHVLRRDQAIIGAAGHIIIQGDARWLTPAGAPVFETLNTYGVDRDTRRNLAGLGDVDRQGQYLFPPHTQRLQYDFWDPLYGGPWVVTFDHVESFRGVDVYVFDARTDGIDESAGYDALPDVPEKYRALTHGQGRIWVEPVSGVVVDQRDAGTSHFTNPGTGQRVGEPINQWRQRFTDETIEAQIQLATATRRQILALELWLPAAFAAVGLICIVMGSGAGRGAER